MAYFKKGVAHFFAIMRQWKSSSNVAFHKESSALKRLAAQKVHDQLDAVVMISNCQKKQTISAN